MTSTLTPTWSLCGLRFENRPLLELHVREDHPQLGTSAQPGQGKPADAPVSQPHPHSPANRHGQRAAAPRTEAGTAIAGPRRPRRPHTGWVMFSLRRGISAFRHANAELMLASELMLHPAGRPHPRQSADPPAGPDGHRGTPVSFTRASDHVEHLAAVSSAEQVKRGQPGVDST
jgi:hypothetical protein